MRHMTMNIFQQWICTSACSVCFGELFSDCTCKIITILMVKAGAFYQSDCNLFFPFSLHLALYFCWVTALPRCQAHKLSLSLSDCALSLSALFSLHIARLSLLNHFLYSPSSPRLSDSCINPLAPFFCFPQTSISLSGFQYLTLLSPFLFFFFSSDIVPTG